MHPRPEHIIVGLAILLALAYLAAHGVWQWIGAMF